MNIKQKMIAAMAEVRQKAYGDVPLSDMIDAALTVLADPENWTDGMDIAVSNSDWMTGHGPLHAVINHVKGLPS